MIRLIAFFVVIGLLVGAYMLIKKGTPLQRGLVGENLVSTGQPAFALEATQALSLEAAGQMNVPLQTPQIGNANAQGKCWYAFYADKQTTTNPSGLLAFFVDTQNPWQWDMSTASGEQEVHIDTTELDGKPAHAATFVLTPQKDPWTALMHGLVKDANTSNKPELLVRRFTMLMQHRRAKLIIEYREAVTNNGDMRPLEDFKALASFEERAKKAFILHTSITGQAPEVTKLHYAPEDISRKALAKTLGTVRRRTQRD